MTSLDPSRRVRGAVLIALLAVGASAACEREASRSDPAADDFERQALGANWVVHNGHVGIVDGRALGVLSKRGEMLGLGIVTWNARFSADQFSEAVIAPGIDAEALYQVFVRRRVSDRQRYGFHWYREWQLKRDGGYGAPVLTTAPSARPAPGDTIRIEVVGSVIRGLHNGVEVIRATDSVLTEPGQPGVALNVAGVTSFPTPFYESWRGGSLQPQGR